jgi:hypothetical protein
MPSHGRNGPVEFWQINFLSASGIRHLSTGSQNSRPIVRALVLIAQKTQQSQ